MLRLRNLLRVTQAAIFGAGIAFSTTAFAQDTDIFAECSVLGTIDSTTSRQLDERLLEIDRKNHVGLMAPAHVELMEVLDGALNYCALEKRLRALGAKTRLLALPLTEFCGREGCRIHDCLSAEDILHAQSITALRNLVRAEG
jgi:hypothetical protein